MVRATAIATGLPYERVYRDLFDMGKQMRVKQASPRTGVEKKVYRTYFSELGYTHVAKMGIGTGCQVHVCVEEIPPKGTFILNLSKHVSCVIDGTILDTHDPSRNGNRCVYGWWEQCA